MILWLMKSVPTYKSNWNSEFWRWQAWTSFDYELETKVRLWSLSRLWTFSRAFFCQLAITGMAMCIWMHRFVRWLNSDCIFGEAAVVDLWPSAIRWACTSQQSGGNALDNIEIANCHICKKKQPPYLGLALISRSTPPFLCSISALSTGRELNERNARLWRLLSRIFYQEKLCR